ncbi:glycosyltransferase family 2 protein [Jutongia huaianensis]|mgnify:FL=1|uniref:Glycosyltransferase family 2 protein n=1 Tax=Jutongia huaianensis TaxID=2763668 RepID=A0ABR7N2J2_9FIRM|nr:glycosyltransferase family 2 protein [Jutongia huaianensis]MBC8562267.1 glycosyltransferase family 2 protein [Jutongia huaianensis]
MDKVSIIIPVYNAEKYLRKCLDSVMSQDYGSYEVICVNDCSPDNSREILEEYRGKYPEKIVVLENEENMGQGRSRMRALKQASGEYFMFVDSDDYIAQDYIFRFMSEVEKEPYDIVVAGFTKDIEGKKVLHDIKDSAWTLVCYPLACAKMFRTAFIREHDIDFSKVRVGEDIYFSIAIFYENVKYKIIHYFGYYYRFNAFSTTESLTYDREHEKYVAEMFRVFLEKYDLQKISEEKRRMIEYTYVANMVNALITYGHGCHPAKMKKKYQFWLGDMKQKFPDYKRNPYYGIFKPKGQSSKIRLGVGVTMLLHRVHLDTLMFRIISWL